tara:strand:+ start:385 stop:696 length:312 start_codon:yes stop_codon:yes gene_type:complete
VIINAFVFILFLISFIAIAERIYWVSKNQYLKSKSKYLRELIIQKNNLNSPDQSFSSCVYQNWNVNGMDLSKAYLSCTSINQNQNSPSIDSKHKVNGTFPIVS